MSQSQNRTTLSLSKNSASDKNRNNADSKAAGQNKAKRVSGKPTKNKGGAGKAPFKKGTSNKSASNRSNGSHKPSGSKRTGGSQRNKNNAKPVSGLHPRNQHTGRYDFELLVAALPELKEHLIKNPVGEDTINFSNPLAVKLLNKALLAHHYGVKHWDIPAGYLCPPIPGRADYIHRVADILNSDGQGEPYNHASVKALDIGVGANCIYPIIGTTEYKWRCTGTDVDTFKIDCGN